VLEEFPQVILVPSVGEIFNLQVVEGGLLALAHLLVLAFHPEDLPLVFLFMELFNCAVHTLLLLEAHEAEAL